MRSSVVLVACCGHVLSLPWTFALTSSSSSRGIKSPSSRTGKPHAREETPGVSRAAFLTTSFISLVGLCIPVDARNLPESTAADPSKAGSVEALVPLVTLRTSLNTIQQNLQQRKSLEDIVTLSQLVVELQIPTDDNKFKQLFDAYSDNISYKQRFVDQNAFLVYYSKGFDGPGRPSIENDLPVKQTMQYGARNEAAVAWEAFLDEVRYLSKHPADGSIQELDEMLAKVITSVDDYLKLAPDDDRVKANKLAMTR